MNQIIIDAVSHAMVLAELEALSARKRKQWKSRLTDASGTHTRLIYRDGRLLNYSVIENEFVPVVSSDCCDVSRMIPLTQLGAQLQAGRNIDEATAEQIAANHTGNHYRNHTTKVSARIYGR